MALGSAPACHDIVNVHQLSNSAEQRLLGPVWDYISAGASDEYTLRSSTQQWNEIELAPRALVDGGIRRGADIAKALCLGATAVFIGRPYVWGLAVFGANEVKRTVEILRTELAMAMALLGAPRLANLDRDLL